MNDVALKLSSAAYACGLCSCADALRRPPSIRPAARRPSYSDTRRSSRASGPPGHAKATPGKRSHEHAEQPRLPGTWLLDYCPALPPTRASARQFCVHSAFRCRPPRAFWGGEARTSVEQVYCAEQRFHSLQRCDRQTAVGRGVTASALDCSIADGCLHSAILAGPRKHVHVEKRAAIHKLLPGVFDGQGNDLCVILHWSLRPAREVTGDCGADAAATAVTKCGMLCRRAIRFGLALRESAQS